MDTTVTTGLRVLVIDDEKNIRTTVALCLESIGCVVTLAEDSAAALRAVEHNTFQLAFLDLRLGSQSGMELLPLLLAKLPTLSVVMITAYGTIDTAVEAMKRGARDFLPKPFTPAQLRHVVERLTQQAQLEQKLATLAGQLSEAAPEVDLNTRSPAMQVAIDQVQKAALHDVSLLLLGESGTGKGVLAQAAHQLSARRAGPFVAVNCPTLSEELLASELFGHAKGAFTGAVRDQAGRVEAASGGTLFLDEIGEIPASLQTKLLRFLQDKHFERLGESQSRVADVRVIAATNRPLESEVKEGRFREDLYYRLNTIEVTLPPLRERPEDLLPLVERFLEFFARSMKRRVPVVTEAAKRMLVSYRWPGNVRELRNTLERAMIFSAADTIGNEDLPSRIRRSEAGPRVQIGGNCTLEEVEREHLQRVIARVEVLETAANILGIDESTLYRKRKRYQAE